LEKGSNGGGAEAEGGGGAGVWAGRTVGAAGGGARGAGAGGAGAAEVADAWTCMQGRRWHRVDEADFTHPP